VIHVRKVPVQTVVLVVVLNQIVPLTVVVLIPVVQKRREKLKVENSKLD
jgi:hypothetical protein